MQVPWLPISVVGTAVAFYVGFKNNQAYDRLWEARKIWGSIINSSRGWGSTAKAFVKSEQIDFHAYHKKFIYRHIGWLYALRNQLLIPTTWERIKQHPLVARKTRRHMAS